MKKILLTVILSLVITTGAMAEVAHEPIFNCLLVQTNLDMHDAYLARMVYDADMAEALRDFADELSVVGSEFRVLIAIDVLEVEDGFQAEFDRLVLTSSAALLDKAHALDRDRIAVAATVEENRAWMEDGKRYGAVGA